MAVALHQQGVIKFTHLCEFPFSAEFEGYSPISKLRMQMFAQAMIKMFPFLVE